MGKAFLVLLLCFSLSSVGATECRDLLDMGIDASVPIGELRPNFPHTTNYDVDLDVCLPVKNQRSTSMCHLYTWSANLEHHHGIETSAEYLSALYILDSALSALQEGNPGFIYQFGANALESIRAIRKFGILPKQAWAGKADFHNAPQINRLLESLQNIVARALVFKNEESNPLEKAKIEQKAQEQISAIFNAMVGPIPNEFEYQGERYTPRSFAQRFFPEVFNPIVKLWVPNDGDIPSTGMLHPEGTDIHLSMDQMQIAARAVLDSGRPVYIGYQHSEQYIDNKMGIMSIEAFNFPPMATTLSRPTRDSLQLWNGSHAALVVGYELDPLTGKVRKWKIQNSWGENAGDKGYFHMYDDYFRKYAFNIIYLDDRRIPLPAFARPPGL